MQDFNRLIHDQVAHAYHHAPAIRAIMDQSGVHPEQIQSVSDLARIPVLSKDALQQMQQNNPPFGGFLTIPAHHLKRIYLSPGPIYDPHGEDTEALENMAEAFYAAGFQAEDRVVNTFMYHMVPAGLLMDEALTGLGATVIPMGPGNTDVQIQVIRDLQVNAYVGTPSFLNIIYNKAEKIGIELPLEKAFFTAEPYLQTQRERFEHQYGLRTAQAYATADLGLIAYQPTGDTGLIIPRHLVVQICSPETGEPLPEGEPGEVVVTTFNKTYPLIRFGTGDLAAMETITLDDGSTFQQLQGILGRSGEAVKVRGMFLHPNALRTAAVQFSNIKQIQAVVSRQHERDHVQLQVVLSGGELNQAALKDAARNAARLTIDEVVIVDALEGSRLVRDTRDYV